MPDTLGFVTTLAREKLSRSKFERIPEPMIMKGANQVDAYADSGMAEDGIMAASNLFHAAHATQAIYECKHVIDLGCGPATQLIRIALLNPHTHFVGVELSSKMIARAHDFIHQSGVKNVEIVQEDITLLKSFSDRSTDGVISTMTLHHLPNIESLRMCFQQIRRVLKSRGALYLADFGRMKTLKSVDFFAHMHKEFLHPEVVRDYENSLRAAFSSEEFQSLAKEELPKLSKVYMTFFVPFMVVIKSKNRSVDPLLQSSLVSLRNSLSPRFQYDLNNLRYFFRLGGLNDNIFSGKP